MGRIEWDKHIGPAQLNALAHADKLIREHERKKVAHRNFLLAIGAAIVGLFMAAVFGTIRWLWAI